MTFNEEEDGDTLVEEVPQIERGTVFLRDTYCHVRFTKGTVVASGSRVKSVLPWAMTKWTNHIVALYEEEDEDTFLEEGPQIEIGTVFLRDTCHRESY